MDTWTIWVNLIRDKRETKVSLANNINQEEIPWNTCRLPVSWKKKQMLRHGTDEEAKRYGVKDP